MNDKTKRMPMPPKPGWKTTEFWVTVAVQIVGLMAAAGIFTSEQASHWQRVAEMAGGLVAMIVSNIAYAQGRAKVKSAEAQNQGECVEPIGQRGSAQICAMAAILASVTIAFFACNCCNRHF